MSEQHALVIDLDDTAQPFQQFFNIHAEPYLGFLLQYEDVTQMYLATAFPDLVTKEQEHAIAYATYEDPRLWECEPIEGSVEALQQLALWLTIYPATARPASINKPTVKYLRHHYGAIFRDVHHIGLRGSGEHDGTKLDFAKKVKALAIAEDTRHHLDGCAEAGIQGILFDRPWNRSEPDHPDFVRVYHWKEVPPILEKLAGR